MDLKISNSNQPSWSEINVKSNLPDNLKCLEEIANNLWWTWNSDAYYLFHKLDKEVFRQVNQNAVKLLAMMGYDKLKELSEDKDLVAEVNKIYAQFRAYMDAKPNSQRPSVAYFCMEYGLSHILKIYSGGLGVLAGDYLKEASDSNVDLCGVGFLYRYGYFVQTLTIDGQQVAKYEASNFKDLPLEKVLADDGINQLVVDVPFPNYIVHAYVWCVNVGRVKLYLLDTDNDMNSEFDRNITHTLYGGDWENRLKQEYLLGIGGMHMLEKLGIKKDIYHCNEGHAALCNIQRLADYVSKGCSFNEAMEIVRASSLYTVHTPVPAGHDYFDESLFGKYIGAYSDKLGISWDKLIGLGRTNPEDKNEKFCMSTFLCNTCQEINGVSKLHGSVSQKMFNDLWKGYFPEENHVGYVTNGVHFPTWASREFKSLYDKYFDKNFMNDESNPEIWKAIYDVPNDVIWKNRIVLKTKLIDYIRRRFRQTWLKNQGDPSRVYSLLEDIKPNALIIGFARRFATYKRAHLLFNDLDRLSKIVNDPKRPVQIIFAGKAHPADGAGQGLIKRIYEISQKPEFLGKILFLENYDMQLARRLVSGVDIWLNTPTRPLEASGTSGEKALMNGVLNFSVLDGWWYEGYRKGAGWAITDKRTYDNQAYQDELDASTIYSTLEHEIIPLYYSFNNKEYSENWVQTIKNSIAQIAPHYTMKRQLDDYYDKFYSKLNKQFKVLSANDNAKAKDLVQWKEKVAERWNDIKIISVKRSDSILENKFVSGGKFSVECVIDEQGLDDALGIEMVIIKVEDEGDKFHKALPLKVTSHQGNLYTFKLEDSVYSTGVFKFAFRMFPQHNMLVHRQNFCYVRWF